MLSSHPKPQNSQIQAFEQCCSFVAFPFVKTMFFSTTSWPFCEDISLDKITNQPSLSECTAFNPSDTRCSTTGCNLPWTLGTPPVLMVGSTYSPVHMGCSSSETNPHSCKLFHWWQPMLTPKLGSRWQGPFSFSFFGRRGLIVGHTYLVTTSVVLLQDLNSWWWCCPSLVSFPSLRRPKGIPAQPSPVVLLWRYYLMRCSCSKIMSESVHGQINDRLKLALVGLLSSAHVCLCCIMWLNSALYCYAIICLALTQHNREYPYRQCVQRKGF